MGSEASILTSALDRVGTLAGAPPISWPNVDFTPPATGLWIEARLFPNTTDNPFWGASSLDEYLGFLQISVYFRPNTGIVTATNQAEAIADHFAKGLALGPVEVSRRPSLAAAVYEDGYGFIPITIPYRGLA